MPTMSTSAPSPSPSPPPPKSRLAIVALVLALVPCCPPTGLLAAFLGMVAMRRISRAGGRLGGRRIAIAAVLVGASTAVIWAGLGEHIAGVQEEAQSEALVRQIEVVVRPEPSDDPDASARLASAWATGPGLPPTDGAIEAFRAAAVERYGRLDRVSIVSSTTSRSLTAPKTECALAFHFEGGGRRGGVARFQGKLVTPLFVHVFKLNSLTLEDADAGDLHLGLLIGAGEPAAEGHGGTDSVDVP